MAKIPVSVLVVTKNEERRIERCLSQLSEFAEVIVIDSNSRDATQDIAKRLGARVIPYEWNGAYPKKRQWVLDTQNIGCNWVFWLDADEVLGCDIIQEIKDLYEYKPIHAGYFIKGQYLWDGVPLKYGLINNKLALFDRRKIYFPEIDDLDCDAMGEIEGHYQPVLKPEFSDEKIGQLHNPVLHDAYDNKKAWLLRHEKYAKWEAYMNANKAWPKDPVRMREVLKKITRTSPFRPYLMFLYSYFFRLGFLDGRAGYEFALSRKRYCDLVLNEMRNKSLK